MKRGLVVISIVVVAILIFYAISIMNKPKNQATGLPSMQISSSEFAQNASIPARFTCDGENISPPLSITDIPREAKTLALIMDDPDASGGTWDHWILFNISTEGKKSILIQTGGQSREGLLRSPVKEGHNSWGRTEYGGPCPPKSSHRYYFKVYALDIELALTEGVTKKQIEAAMQGHTLGYGELMGTYSRAR